MATELIRQAMFSSGEIDAIHYHRTDFKDYLTAAQSLLNVEVGTTGLAKKRKGTKFLLQTHNHDPNSKLYGFQDKNNHFYILLSLDKQFDVYKINNDESLSYYQTLTTPYLSADLDGIDYTLDNDSLILVHGKYPPARITIKDYANTVFTYEVLNLYPLPAYDFGDVDYSKAKIALSTTNQVITATVYGVIFDSSWIGGELIGAGTSEFSPIGYGIITAVRIASGNTVFTANEIVPFKTGDTTGTRFSIRKPAFSAVLGYPSRVLYYQNRLWFANTATLSNTLFGSRINAPVNFDVGTGQDTDAIIYTLGQSDSGGIVWMNSGKQLEVYTANYEFVAPQEQNVGLTPSTFSIRQQSAYGVSEKLKPLSYLNDSYYLNKTGNAIINFRFQGIGQSYLASNISQASSHLVKNPTKAVLLRGTDTSQDNFIYFLNPDHSITVFQFAHEINLAALTPISVQEQVQIQDIVSINNTIYLLKIYGNSQQTVLEKMDENVKIDGYEIKQLPESGLIEGLNRFEDISVQVIFNNQDYGIYPVKEGKIQVNNLEKNSGACFVGLLYPVEIRPMYFYAGSSHADLMKQTTKIYVEYFQSLNFYINDQLVNYQVFTDIQQGKNLTTRSGTAITVPILGWNRDKTFVIKQNAPFDLNITAIAYQVTATMI
ncbi:hypothetical protein [Rickettsiella endosymbiont of Dermanyssus gallinae]|uniref:hypothetical protein n=1 Tax=Rickettsiella endosymbiont of Dermanyssus gallinae TaxID=2856608 RepID=UPI001C533C3C|nr:hypothetical protein [Rickettsiella endosymbiont of Dermanyssus gallinae]